jgi:hypothetical protein
MGINYCADGWDKVTNERVVMWRIADYTYEINTGVRKESIMMNDTSYEDAMAMLKSVASNINSYLALKWLPEN